MTRKTPDFYWTMNAPFVNLIPLNEQSEDAWREIAASFPQGAIPFFAWDSVRKQLQEAGYRVHKTPRPKKSDISDEQLLAELGVEL